MTIDLKTALQALPGFPALRGPRVRLRGPRTDDATALFALFSDPAVMRYWSRPPMTELGEAEGLIDEMQEAFAQREMLQWVSVDAHDAVIGTCTLFHFDARHRRAELGYALRSQDWNKGLAREAATLAIDWAIRTLGLHRIDASIDPDNAASRRLLHKLGFVTEGLQRKSYFVGDVVTDSELLGLLASDWQAR